VLTEYRRKNDGTDWLSESVVAADEATAEPENSTMIRPMKVVRINYSGFDDLQELARIVSLFSIKPPLDSCYQQIKNCLPFIIYISSPTIFNSGHHQSIIAYANVHTAVMFHGQAIRTPLGCLDQNSQSKLRRRFGF
jgi:hypothetical protein